MKHILLIFLLALSISIYGQTQQDSVKVQPMSGVPSIEVEENAVFLMQQVIGGKSVWVKFNVGELYNFLQYKKIPRSDAFDGQALIFEAGQDSFGYESFTRYADFQAFRDSALQVLSIDSTATDYIISLENGGSVNIPKSGAVGSESDPVYSIDAPRLADTVFVNELAGVFDTTWIDDGGSDVSSPWFGAKFELYQKVKLNLILNQASTSPWLVNLPSPETFKNKEIEIIGTDSSVIHDIVILNIFDNNNYVLSQSELVILESSLINEDYQWVFKNNVPQITGPKQYVFLGEESLINSEEEFDSGEVIIVGTSTYIVTSSTAFSVDSTSVIPIQGSKYAILQPMNGEFALSKFKISLENDSLTNTQNLQRAIEFAEGYKIVSDIDSFSLTAEAGIIDIRNDIELDFTGSSIKVYPETATDVQNDFFNLTYTPATGDIEFRLTGGIFWTAQELGFPETGGSGPAPALQPVAFIDTDGSVGAIADLRIEGVTIRGLYPQAVLVNSLARLWLNDCDLEGSRTNMVGVFGIGNEAYITNNTIRGGSWPEFDFGVQTYLHPYPKRLVYENNLHTGWRTLSGIPEIARCFQYASGTAAEETTFPNPSVPVDYHIIQGNIFEQFSDKAIVTSWFYPGTIYKDNKFYGTGNAYQITGPATIDGDFFSSNTGAAVVFSFPSQNRDETHKYNFRNLNVKSIKGFELGDDEGDTPWRALVNIENSTIECSGTTFTLSGLNATNDSSRINMNIKDSYFVSTSPNAIYTNNHNANVRFSNCTFDWRPGGLVFNGSSTFTNTGKTVVENCTFLNIADDNNPRFFEATGATEAIIREGSYLFKNNLFPDEDNLGFAQRDTNQTLRVRLNDDLYYDTLTTSTIQLNWNYDKYYVNSSTLTNAFIGRTSAVNGITDPMRMVGGELQLTFTSNCSIDETGNFDLINTTLEAQAGETITFVVNPSTRKWTQKEFAQGDLNREIEEVYFTETVIMSEGVSSSLVNLPTQLQGSTLYQCQCNVNSTTVASPTADNMAVWVTGRTTTQFTVNLGASPGVGESTTVECTLYKK